MIVSMSEFKFEVSRVELSKHLGARVEHHTERAKFYAGKASTLRETTEKYVSAESGKDVTLPEEILEQIAVEPSYSGVGGLRDWAEVAPVSSFRGARLKNMAFGVQRAAANAQDQIKSQVVQQLESLTMRYDGMAKLHRVRVEELSFYLAHLPTKVGVYELCFADLARFELVRGAGAGPAGAMYVPSQILDEEAFG